jgi:hypothetical protein
MFRLSWPAFSRPPSRSLRATNSPRPRLPTSRGPHSVPPWTDLQDPPPPPLRMNNAPLRSAARSRSGPRSARGEQPEEDFDLMTVLFVTRPDGSQKRLIKGENLHVLVYDIPGSTPFPGDICGEDPVYTGTGRAIFTDNDVDLSHPGVDASGNTVTGTVTDASGQRYHLVAAIRFTVPENTLNNFVIHAHAEKIQLTPIGH